MVVEHDRLGGYWWLLTMTDWEVSYWWLWSMTDWVVTGGY